MQAIGTVSSFAAGQLPTACYTLLCAAGCAAVVFLGWRHGSRDFGPLDAVCVTLAAEGVALLAVATWCPGSSRCRGRSPCPWRPTCWPTCRRSTTRGAGPDEEPWLPYAMFGAAAALVLLVTDFRVLVGVIYPTYLFAADAAMVIMILASPHYAAPRRRRAARARFRPEPPMRLSAASAQWRPVTGKDWRQPDRPAAGARRVPLMHLAARGVY